MPCCQGFATSLLDHARSSYELEVMLNYAAEVRACAVQYNTVKYSTVQNNSTDLDNTMMMRTLEQVVMRLRTGMM